MSVPPPAPAPPGPAAPSRERLLPLRLLGAAALVAVGFVLVWQGFGLAGCGTDAHAKRVSWACFQLLGFGVALACARGWLAVRALVALAFLGSACGAWWTVRSSNLKSAVSLREAAGQRDEMKKVFARPLDDVRDLKGTKAWFELLSDQYPSLVSGWRDEYTRWIEDEERVAAEKMRLVPATEYALAREWSDRLTALREAGGPGRSQHDAVREWLLRARAARDAELRQVPPGDWAGFDRTAPGRRAFVDAFGGVRAFVVVSEDEWASRSVRDLVAGAGSVRPRRQALIAIEKNVLALKSIETGDGRFATARQILFRSAHEAAQAEIAAHLDAGRYDAAFGLARTHAVEWGATATLLDEAKKLDALRDYCAAFARLSAVSAQPPEPVEVAPPPRPKPE